MVRAGWREGGREERSHYFNETVEDETLSSA